MNTQSQTPSGRFLLGCERVLLGLLRMGEFFINLMVGWDEFRKENREARARRYREMRAALEHRPPTVLRVGALAGIAFSFLAAIILLFAASGAGGNLGAGILCFTGAALLFGIALALAKWFPRPRGN
jgi:hypothetical protein